jgi:hypothetical protein
MIIDICNRVFERLSNEHETQLVERFQRHFLSN